MSRTLAALGDLQGTSPGSRVLAGFIPTLLNNTLASCLVFTTFYIFAYFS